MRECPCTQQWDSFLADLLPADVEASLEAHLNQCPDCQAHLEGITNPSTLERVADFLQTLPRRSQVSGRMVDVLLHALNTDSTETPSQPLPEIPGYQLIELIGQGGSSIVYRAIDSSLQRSVAIKVLRDKCTPVQRQRFHKEARSLASLHHLNVASIIEVGETAQHTFLVLEYITGGSLASYLAGLPQPPAQAARLVQQLASAVQKAHDTGFIHRDLKPSNILLDPHFGASETTGLDRYVPKIIDFGIVKDLNPTEDFTQTRDFVGTPSYMAPEQISQSKQPIDVRTDVYALGIILYELLTGRPPFRAASPIDTMLQIKHDEPVPPTRFEPKLPRDLENICLKCIEKDPARRYAGARLLHDDLSRFLNMQPVQARPISWPARCWRWSRRNPGWAIAATFITLILLILAIVGPLLAAHEHHLREQAAKNAELAAFERNRARDHLDLAGNALEELLDRLLSNTRLQDSIFEEMQKGLVGFAMPYLEQFVQQEDSSANLRLRQAKGLLQLAMVQTKTGDHDNAQATYEKGLTQLQELQTLANLSQESRLRSLSLAHLEYGRFLTIYRKQDREAEEHFRQSLALLEKIGQGTSHEKYLDSFAILYSLIGSVISPTQQRIEESKGYIVKAVEARERLVELHPDRDDLRHYAAMARMNLGIFYRDNGPVDQEVEQFQLALDHELKVNHSKSVWIESPYHVTLLHGECGAALYRAGKKTEALEHLKTAIKTADALETVYPGVEKYTVLHKRAQVMLKHFDK